MTTPTQTPAPRAVAAVQRDLDAALTHYRGIANTAPVADVAAASERARVLQEELHAAYAVGAKACPRCGTAAVGMLKTPRINDKDGNLKSGAVYEVGCRVCVERSRGGAPAEAVEEWNADRYVMRDGQPA